jgi:uncharacterized membrane protein YhaH (DUF805 family)
VTPLQAVQTSLRKYATFSGRASRSEFWYFTAFLFAGSQVAAMAERLTWRIDGATQENGATYFTLAFSAATLIPSIANQVRRFHDTGKSGALVAILYAVIFFSFTAVAPMGGTMQPTATGQGLAVIVLLAALITLLSFNIRPSTPGTNTYGPNPHEVPS